MRRVRVLVVDDEEDFATAVTERLTRRGFDATSALSGARALELLEESRFDVVTLDLKMPGMDGLATLREVRKIDPHVPVILLTGHGTVSSGVEGMQGGAADFLQKPVTIEILGTAIEAAAERVRSNRAIAPEGDGGET